MIQEAIGILTKGNDLKGIQMQQVMEEIISGSLDTRQIVSFLNLLSKKKEIPEELTAAVEVLRRHVVKIRTKHRILLDTCGTGGDKSGTFNISTAVAFVASGSGIAVAKHGNRCVSSHCGSADILEALGVNIRMEKEKIEQCLDEVGIAFLFAQELHPAMKNVAAARKEIGAKTIFNLIGPLTNPAGATHQLIGVYDKRWTEAVCQVLKNLGSVHALAVHGEDGLDEITTTANTRISELHQGRIKSYEIGPEQFGLKKAVLEELRGEDASYNAKIMLDILNAKAGPCRQIVILNAAAAIYAADKAGSLEEGIKLASESIDSGKALEKLNLLKAFSRK